MHTNRRNDIRQNIILGALLRQGLRKPNLAQFGRGVIRLTKASKQTRGRRSIHNPAVLLLPEVGPGSLGALVSAIGMHTVDQVPVLVLHVLEADIAQDPGVVDEDVDAAEVLDGRVDDGLAVLDAVVVGGSVSTGGFDLGDDDVCCLFLLAGN